MFKLNFAKCFFCLIAVFFCTSVHAQYSYGLHQSAEYNFNYPFQYIQTSGDSMLVFYYLETDGNMVTVHSTTLDLEGNFSPDFEYPSVEIDSLLAPNFVQFGDRILISTYFVGQMVYDLIIIDGNQLYHIQDTYITDQAIWSHYFVYKTYPYIKVFDFNTLQTTILTTMLTSEPARFVTLGDEYLILDEYSYDIPIARKIFDPEMNLINSYNPANVQIPSGNNNDLSNQLLSNWNFSNVNNEMYLNYNMSNSDYVYYVAGQNSLNNLLHLFVQDDTLRIDRLFSNASAEFMGAEQLNAYNFFLVDYENSLVSAKMYSFTNHVPFSQNTLLPNLAPVKVTHIQNKPVIINSNSTSDNFTPILYNQNFGVLFDSLSFDSNTLGLKVFSLRNTLYFVGVNTIHVIEMDSIISTTDPISPESKLSLSVYPSPFQGHATIKVKSETNSPVNVSVYNIKGQKVNVWTIESPQAGKTLIWKGENSKGEKLSTGMYFLKVTNRESQFSKKVLLIK